MREHATDPLLKSRHCVRKCRAQVHKKRRYANRASSAGDGRGRLSRVVPDACVNELLLQARHKVVPKMMRKQPDGLNWQHTLSPVRDNVLVKTVVTHNRIGRLLDAQQHVDQVVHAIKILPYGCLARGRSMQRNGQHDASRNVQGG